MIEVAHLTKDFRKKRALDDVSFTVRDGRVTGFLGPNGAGKSTTMKCILGLFSPTSGGCLVNGRRYTATPAPITEAGAVLEAHSFHSGRTAYEHLEQIALTHGIPTNRVNEVIELTGLSSVARKKTNGFSLGMCQRLSIAAALLGRPRTLILDEPINGLDLDGVRWVRDLCRTYAAQGNAVFLSSHLMEEVSLVADDLIVIGRGRIMADTTLDEFVAAYSHHGTRLVTPRPDDARKALAAMGVTITPQGRGKGDPPDAEAMLIEGRDPVQIATALAAWGIPVYEFRREDATLEDAYLAFMRGRGMEEYEPKSLSELLGDENEEPAATGDGSEPGAAPAETAEAATGDGEAGSEPGGEPAGEAGGADAAGGAATNADGTAAEPAASAPEPAEPAASAPAAGTAGTRGDAAAPAAAEKPGPALAPAGPSAAPAGPSATGPGSASAAPPLLRREAGERPAPRPARVQTGRRGRPVALTFWRQVKCELYKSRTLLALCGMEIVGVILIVANGLLPLWIWDIYRGRYGAPQITMDQAMFEYALRDFGSFVFLAGFLAVYVVTNETASAFVQTTLTVSPRRIMVLLAKAAAAGIANLVSLAVGVPLVMALIVGIYHPVGALDLQKAGQAAVVLVALTLIVTVLGCALGAMTRSTVMGVFLIILLDSALAQVIDLIPNGTALEWMRDASNYLPSQFIVDAVMLTDRSGATGLDWVGSLLGFAAWALILGLASAILVDRRDVVVRV